MSEEEHDMRRPITAIAAATSTLCIGVAVAGQGETLQPSETATGSGIDVQVPDSKDRIEEYWTRDRMRAAKPTPKPVIPRGPTLPGSSKDGSDETQ